MGASPSLGYPPHGSMISDAANIRRKCTCSCSACDRCLLAMDNQCSWFENYLDYFNVRYYHLYIAYMVAGVAFVMIVGLDLWYNVLWINETIGMGECGVLGPFQAIGEYDSENSPREHDLPYAVITEAQIITENLWKRKAIVCIAITFFSVLFAFGILLITHVTNIITRVNTSEDLQINTQTGYVPYSKIKWYTIPTTIERWP